MPTQAEEYLEAYGEHARILRSWLVAYGIGAPVLLMTNDRLATAIQESRNARLIAGCFLTGVALQVVLAAINKASMWGLYYGEVSPGFQKVRWYRMAHWLSERFWTDLLVDIVTLGLFLFATLKAFVAVIRAV